MATAFVTFHRNVGPGQVQAPANKISDATPLAVGAEAHTAAVADACLAEISTDSIISVTYGLNATASTTVGQRLPAGAYGYFLWLNAGERVSVIAQT